MDRNRMSGSVMRGTLLVAAALLLVLSGQWRSGLLVGGALAVMNLLVRAVDASGPGRKPAAASGEGEAGSASGARSTEQTKPQSPDQQKKSQESASGIMGTVKNFLDKHPNLKAFIEKLGKDNIGMLAAFVSWSALTSIVPIIVGLVAISGLILQNPSTQASVVSHLYNALQGALTVSEIQSLIKNSAQHAGLLAIIGFLGTLWGASNLGGSISTAFQAIFEVQGRPFIREKLIDIGMIFVFAILMLIIIAANSATTLVAALFSGFPVPGGARFVIATLVGLVAAFLLFTSIYLVFPNIRPPFRYGNVWKGGLVSAVLFQILSYIWPLYTRFAHFSRYGAVLSSVLLLAAWIYFFAEILMLGAEVVAFGAIREAEKHDEPVGPQPQENVPQHEVLRAGQPSQQKTA